MKIIVHLAGIARDLAGKENISIEIVNSEHLYDVISASIPGLENFYFLISINGRIANNHSLMKEEDNILVFSPTAGG